MANKAEHPFDERSKTYYTQYFQNKNIRAGRQFEVFSRGRSIDVVTECTDEDILALKDTCFSHFKRVNSLEFKGPHDPLTTPDLSLITSRTWAMAGRDQVEQKEVEDEAKFLGEQTLKEIADYPSRRTVTIICITRPDRILNTPELQTEYGFSTTDEPGVYKSSKLLTPIWIIHPTELDVVPKNYPLLPLSRGEKLKQFIDLCVENEWESSLYFTMDIGVTIDPSEIFEKIMEVFNMNVQIRPETAVKFDQFLQERPEFIMQMPTLRQAVRQGQLFGEQIGEERGKKLGEEQGRKIGEEQGILQAEQKMLVRLLNRKFAELPESIVDTVKATTDTNQLEAWTDQILFADSWQEIFEDQVPTNNQQPTPNN